MWLPGLAHWNVLGSNPALSFLSQCWGSNNGERLKRAESHSLNDQRMNHDKHQNRPSIRKTSAPVSLWDLGDILLKQLLWLTNLRLSLSHLTLSCFFSSNPHDSRDHYLYFKDKKTWLISFNCHTPGRVLNKLVWLECLSGNIWWI